MTDRKALEDVVTRFYSARAAGDAEGLMGFLGSEFSFCIVASGKLAPMGQRVCEVEQLKATVHQLVNDWDMSKIRTERLYVDGDTVFAHRAGVIRFRPTGNESETEFIDQFTFKDGKMVDMKEFVDTLMIAETLGMIEA